MQSNSQRSHMSKSGSRLWTRRGCALAGLLAFGALTTVQADPCNRGSDQAMSLGSDFFACGDQNTLLTKSDLPYDAVREVNGAVALVLGMRRGLLDQDAAQLLEEPAIARQLRGAAASVSESVDTIERRLAARFPEDRIDLAMATITGTDPVGTTLQPPESSSARFDLNKDTLCEMIVGYDGYGSQQLLELARAEIMNRAGPAQQEQPDGANAEAAISIRQNWKFVFLNAENKSVDEVVKAIREEYPGRADVYLIYEITVAPPTQDTTPPVAAFVTAKVSLRFRDGLWRVASVDDGLGEGTR